MKSRVLDLKMTSTCRDTFRAIDGRLGDRVEGEKVA
jgi:hypothetical protein